MYGLLMESDSKTKLHIVHGVVYVFYRMAARINVRTADKIRSDIEPQITEARPETNIILTLLNFPKIEEFHTKFNNN